jgi:hypothetical protein
MPVQVQVLSPAQMLKGFAANVANPFFMMISRGCLNTPSGGEREDCEARFPDQGKDDKRFLERSDLGDTRAAMHGIGVPSTA